MIMMIRNDGCGAAQHVHVRRPPAHGVVRLAQMLSVPPPRDADLREHDLALPGRRGAVVEDVAEVRVGVGRAHLGAILDELVVVLGLEVLRLERPGEHRVDELG